MISKLSKKLIGWRALALFLPVLIVLWWSNYRVLDPDFGWHIRLGEEISTNGIPHTDPYSYSMPSFEYVSHEWLTHVLMFHLYRTIGSLGLALLSTAIMLITAFLVYKTVNKGKRWVFLPFAALGSGYLMFGFIRPQVLSWFFLAAVLYLLSIWNRFRLARLFTPVLFLIWANLHGSFVIGLFTLFVYFTTKALRGGGLEKSNLVVGLISLMTTLVNPYGIGVWREVLMTMTDTKLRWTVVEWQPFLIFDFTVWFFIVLTIVFIWLCRDKLKLEQIILYLIFLAMALSSRRHLMLWMVVVIPIFSETLEEFYLRAKKIKFGEKRIKQFFLLINTLTAVGLMFRMGITVNIAQSTSEELQYPVSAVTYLKENPPQGNIFNEYGWGGYLVWKYPGKKIFIDGRMPSWRYEDYPDSESGNAMEDYRNIVSLKKDYKDIFDKYGIDTVIWPVMPKKQEKTGILAYWVHSLSRKLGWVYDDGSFIEKLRSNGWDEAYSDDTAVILQKQ